MSKKKKFAKFLSKKFIRSSSTLILSLCFITLIIPGNFFGGESPVIYASIDNLEFEYLTNGYIDVKIKGYFVFLVSESAIFETIRWDRINKIITIKIFHWPEPAAYFPEFTPVSRKYTFLIQSEGEWLIICNNREIKVSFIKA